MSGSKRLLTFIGSFALFCIVYVWFFGVATAMVVEARYFGWKTPLLKKRPVELTDSSISSARGRKVTFSGYEFEVPWELDDDETKIVGTRQVIVFRSGNAMLVMCAPPREFVNTVLKTFDKDNFQKMYGEEALRSDYAMYRLMLRSTTDDVTLFTPRGEAVGRMMMLVVKGVAIPSEADTGLFSLRSREFKGFQYGDPQRRPTRIIVDLLADEGGIEFNMGQKKDGSSPAITQAEINRLIQTTRRVPVLPSGANH